MVTRDHFGVKSGDNFTECGKKTDETLNIRDSRKFMLVTLMVTLMSPCINL